LEDIRGVGERFIVKVTKRKVLKLDEENLVGAWGLNLQIWKWQLRLAPSSTTTTLSM
jgi:hypothetical protein